MSNQDGTPVPPTPSAASDAVTSSVRTLLVAIGGWLVGKGWLDANIATAAVPVLLIAGPQVWSWLKIRFNHKVVAALKEQANAPQG